MALIPRPHSPSAEHPRSTFPQRRIDPSASVATENGPRRANRGLLGVLLLLPFLAVGAAALPLSTTPFLHTVGVAPALVDGNIPDEVATSLRAGLPELLSWELSMVPGLRVLDPAQIRGAADRGDRTELDVSSVTREREVASSVGADAILLVRFRRSAGRVEIEYANAYADTRRDSRTIQSAVGRERDAVTLLRTAAIGLLDSLAHPVPPSMRTIWQRQGAVSYEALALFARGYAAEAAGDKEGALSLYRDAARIASNFPALTVRQQKLELELRR